MGDVVVATPESQPVSLYLALERGRLSDLEVVAKASLEFAAAIKELAFLVDPSLDIRIELENGEEGSLRLNAWLRQQRSALKRSADKLTPLKTVILTAGTWFLLQTAAITYEEALKYVFDSKDPQVVQLSQADKEDIAKKVYDLGQQASVREHTSKFFKEVEKDPAISAVGIAPDHIRPPENLVPRRLFTPKSKGPQKKESDDHGAQKIRVDSNLLLTIIKPVLKEGGGKWRLSGPQGEFSATIADQIFLDEVMEGKTDVPLAAEIRITVDLETSLEMTPDEVWKPVDYRVLRVHHIERQPSQRRLFGPSEE